MAGRLFRLSAVALIACWACDALAPNEDVSLLTFDVRVVDYFGPPGAGPPIVLFLATETQYPCMNYGLDSKLDVHANTLNVDVSTRVTRPEICLTAIGPAMFRAVLPIIEGVYELESTRAGQTDRYSLTVTHTTIVIATREAHFTRPTADTFPRGS